MRPAGIFGQKLGQPLNLKDAPSLITRTLRSAELAVVETRDDNPLPGLCGAHDPVWQSDTLELRTERGRTFAIMTEGRHTISAMDPATGWTEQSWIFVKSL